MTFLVDLFWTKNFLLFVLRTWEPLFSLFWAHTIPALYFIFFQINVSFWNVVLISVTLLFAFNSPKSPLNVFWAAERSFSKLKLIKT